MARGGVRRAIRSALPPFWVPPAGSPVRLIHLAPVLHPPLIEARRSGAERISGGLPSIWDVRMNQDTQTRMLDAFFSISPSGL